MNRDPDAGKTARMLKGVIGFVLVLISTPCVLGMIHDLLVGTGDMGGALIAGSFFSILAMAGFFLIYLATRKPKARPLHIEEHVERLVLQVARVHAGTITQAQLAMSSSLTLEQAATILTEFERRGVVYSVITTGGGMNYVFPDLLTDEKRTDEEFLLDLGSKDEASSAKEEEQAQTTSSRRS